MVASRLCSPLKHPAMSHFLGDPELCEASEARKYCEWAGMQGYTQVAVYRDTGSASWVIFGWNVWAFEWHLWGQADALQGRCLSCGKPCPKHDIATYCEDCDTDWAERRQVIEDACPWVVKGGH